MAFYISYYKYKIELLRATYRMKTVAVAPRKQFPSLAMAKTSNIHTVDTMEKLRVVGGEN